MTLTHLPNSFCILPFKNDIFSASPWTSITFCGSHCRISCMMPLASAWAENDMYSTVILTSNWKSVATKKLQLTDKSQLITSTVMHESCMIHHRCQKFINTPSCHFMWMRTWNWEYRQTSNISCTLVGNIIVDNSDVVGASPVGTVPTTSSLST